MKYLFTNLGNLVAIICIAAAVYLAVHDKTDWGWFLFIGLLCSGSVHLKSK